MFGVSFGIGGSRVIVMSMYLNSGGALAVLDDLDLSLSFS